MKNTKFKIWDNQERKVFVPTYKAYAGIIEEILITTDGRLALRHFDGMIDESLFEGRFIKLEYIGLKDINGIEIYEGDIVESEMAAYLSGINKTMRGFVCLEPYGPFIKPISIEYNRFNSIRDWEPLTVIGDIYKNPELLK